MGAQERRQLSGFGICLRDNHKKRTGDEMRDLILWVMLLFVCIVPRAGTEQVQ